MANLYAWGNNGTYQAGISGSTASIHIPTLTLTDVTKVNGNLVASYAIKSDGLYGAGWNSMVGKTPASGYTTTFTLVTGGTWSGLNHDSNYNNGAIKSDNTGWVIGQNNDAQLGVGDTTDRYILTKLGTKSWSKLALTFGYGMGITTDGKLWGWGKNIFYSNGLGLSDDSLQTTPLQVGTGTTWSDIKTSWWYFSIGLKSDGTLWSCGRNLNYSTGQGTDAGYTTTMTQIGSDTDWASISFVSGNVYALKTNGKLYGWGLGSSYAFGNGSASNLTGVTALHTGYTWSKIAGGDKFAIGLTTDDKLYSWGESDNYQTGNDTTTDIQTPVQIGTGYTWTDVNVNWNTSFGIGYPELNAGTIASAQTICFNDTPTQLITIIYPSGGISGYTYQWYSGTTTGATDIIAGATGTTYQPPSLTIDTWYSKMVVSSGETGYTNTIKITVYADDLYAGVIGNAQSIPFYTVPAQLTFLTAPSGSSGTYSYQWLSGTTTADDIIAGATGTTYQPPALTGDTYYRCLITDTVCSKTATTLTILINIYGALPPPFCAGSYWTASGSTCGNSDGKINITDLDYFNFYDFTLTDIWGTSYTFNPATGEATGLTSGYYFFTATVKPAYWYYYGRDDCNFDWIKIEDSDNPAFLVGVSVKPLQCQPFDRQFGRIYYNVSGLTSGSTYSFYAFTSDLTLYYSKTGITTTEDFILANADAECYWVLIRDDVTGCAILIDNRCVPSLPMFNQGGIKHLYIAKWSDDLDYNYWKDSDDDYFLEFTDTSFFNSTKIKEYLSLTSGYTGITWYSIPVLPKIVSLSQKLEKVRQGYIFTDTLTVGVAKATAAKWTQMKTILNPEDKWIAIVQDADDFWWTLGYRHGARISVYQFKTGLRGEDDGYGFTFSAVSENKLLTSIDEDYIINYVE